MKKVLLVLILVLLLLSCKSTNKSVTTPNEIIIDNKKTEEFILNYEVPNEIRKDFEFDIERINKKLEKHEWCERIESNICILAAWDYFDLAYSYQHLWYIDKSIKAYSDYIKYYEKAQVAYNNLAALYEIKKEYKNAIRMHLIWIKEFKSNKRYLDVARDFKELWKLDKARRAYQWYLKSWYQNIPEFEEFILYKW